MRCRGSNHAHKHERVHEGVARVCAFCSCACGPSHAAAHQTHRPWRQSSSRRWCHLHQACRSPHRSPCRPTRDGTCACPAGTTLSSAVLRFSRCKRGVRRRRTRGRMRGGWVEGTAGNGAPPSSAPASCSCTVLALASTLSSLPTARTAWPWNCGLLTCSAVMRTVDVMGGA